MFISGNKDYAPVAIPTLNRKTHLERCINSLRACKEAKFTDLYISVDYPPTEYYQEGYNQLVLYLKNGVTGFRNVYVFYQEKNLGVFDNKYFIFDKVFEEYDRIIFTEDDNEVSLNFLDYMNQSLAFIKGNNRVANVSGYTSLTKYFEKSNNIAFIQKSSAWGVAYYKDSWKMIKGHITKDYFENIIMSKALSSKLLSKDPERFTYLVQAMYNDCDVLYMSDKKTIAVLDVSISIYLLMEDLFQLQPIVSKVRCWGNDGSGVNCPVNEAVAMEEIDLSEDFSIHYEASDNCYKDNARQLYRESSNMEKRIIKRYVFFAALYRIFGKKVSLPIYKIHHFFLRKWERSKLLISIKQYIKTNILHLSTNQ